MLPVPTVTQLAEFSGRAESSYPVYATSALKQATMLMTIRTCLVGMPADPDKAELLRYGILELADEMVLKQPYQEVNAKPFTSETIMSYSYSKSAQRAKAGQETGLLWFDLAVKELSVCGDVNGSVASSAISVFEKDGLTDDGTGRMEFLGPDGLYDAGSAWFSPEVK